MRVVHIVGGGITGGAGKGVLNLHVGLLRLGVDSRILVVARKLDAQPEGGELFAPSGVAHYWAGALRMVDRQLSKPLFSAGIFGANPLQSKLVESADIVNLHWLTGAPSISAIGRAKKPIVFTLRDMWAFTGGCHYSLRCEKYTKICGECPRLHSNWKLDRSRFFQAWKQYHWRENPNIHPVGISPWICGEADRSGVFKNNARLIWNGIDRRIFQPLDYIEAVRTLGLDSSFRYLSLGALNIKDEYKGAKLLPEIIARLKNRIGPYVKIITFGNGARSLLGEDSSLIHLGKVNDSKIINCIYAVSVAFLMTSIQEAFGKTVAESLASGTPVVAFNTSGPADMVEHKVSGYLAEPNSVDDFLSGVSFFLDSNCYQKIRDYASERSRLFCSDKMAIEYKRFYETLMHV